jgi:hypothetical protein
MNRFDALNRRIGAAHASWQLAVADLTVEQVNHHERTGVLPIAFSLVHLVTTEDIRVSATFGLQDSIWKADHVQDQIGANVPSVARGTPIDVSETLSLTDINAWREYQTRVFAQTESLIGRQPDSRWDEVMLERVPENMHGGFLHLLVGDSAVILGDYLEVVVYHHAIRHLGELEHARSLVGLTGVGG